MLLLVQDAITGSVLKLTLVSPIFFGVLSIISLVSYLFKYLFILIIACSCKSYSEIKMLSFRLLACIETLLSLNFLSSSCSSNSLTIVLPRYYQDMSLICMRCLLRGRKILFYSFTSSSGSKFWRIERRWLLVSTQLPMSDTEIFPSGTYSAVL